MGMQLRDICFGILFLGACSEKDSSQQVSPPPPTQEPNVTQPTGNLSPADGCGWSFERETDDSVLQEVSARLAGEWIDQTQNNYNSKHNAVSGGRSYTDPATKIEYVILGGYAFSAELKMNSQIYYFEDSTRFFNDPDFLAGFPYFETKRGGSAPFIIGKPLQANPNFRPLERQEDGDCTTMLIHIRDDDRVSVIFGKSRFGSGAEPSIEEYYSDDRFVMTIGRFSTSAR